MNGPRQLGDIHRNPPRGRMYAGRGFESLSRCIWRSSNAVQRGTHIRRHNRKRFDGAVAVVRSVAAAIRALRCVS
jgi:hypothetical protein